MPSSLAPFEGRQAICIHCFSDTHLSSECSENPVNISWPWAAQQPTLEYLSSSCSQWDQPVEKWGTCNLFNALEGSKCTYNPCIFQHMCSECKGKHPRAMCPLKSGSSKGAKSQFMHPQMEWNSCMQREPVSMNSWKKKVSYSCHNIMSWTQYLLLLCYLSWCWSSCCTL